jgi:Domain of unknown function (DUF5659)
MIRLDGKLQTDDMVLATVLKMHGYECELTKSTGSSERVYWVCENTDAALTALVNEYIHGEYRVEPQEFIKRVREVRQALYKFIGHKPKAIGKTNDD